MKPNILTEPLISGIQQIGIGNADVYATWDWYNKNLGMDIPVFDEAAEAALMLPYTGGQPRSRHAILALNLNGGGGAEIWQYTTRKAQNPKFTIQAGDLGIYIAKFKTRDISAAYQSLAADNEVSEILTDPQGSEHFYMKDLNGNLIEVISSSSWFSKTKSLCGGVAGAVIGVSDIESSIDFYTTILGYDKVVYDKQGSFKDYAFFDREQKFRRVLLRHSESRQGPFSQLLGDSEIELIQTMTREPRNIYEDRLWGDPGYIHLCFDIKGMDALRGKCLAHKCGFTVDSGDFDMGEAAGQFAYIEDPDGTLIEFVETQKLPILKKLGWYLDLRKRNPKKPLPKWMLKSMGLNRKKV